MISQILNFFYYVELVLFTQTKESSWATFAYFSFTRPALHRLQWKESEFILDLNQEDFWQYISFLKLSSPST